MDIVPLGPGFAAELRGVTLADIASDDAAYAAARNAFEEHSVLVFRGQEVTDELQLSCVVVERLGLADVGQHAAVVPQVLQQLLLEPQDVVDRHLVHLAVDAGPHADHLLLDRVRRVLRLSQELHQPGAPSLSCGGVSVGSGSTAECVM